jgi:hypothetical protein
MKFTKTLSIAALAAALFAPGGFRAGHDQDRLGDLEDRSVRSRRRCHHAAELPGCG